MAYQFAKTYEGVAKHCCLVMDLALDEGYLEPTITVTFGENARVDVRPPHMVGAKITERGRKRKPNVLITFCPWCGKKLEDKS